MKSNEFVLRMVVRLLELHRENEKLKKEAKARRYQADTWRRKYKTIKQGA